jgi:hypothetical protein
MMFTGSFIKIRQLFEIIKRTALGLTSGYVTNIRLSYLMRSESDLSCLKGKIFRFF